MWLISEKSWERKSHWQQTTMGGYVSAQMMVSLEMLPGNVICFFSLRCKNAAIAYNIMVLHMVFGKGHEASSCLPATMSTAVNVSPILSVFLIFLLDFTKSERLP
jgi:hypothetical protein